MDNNQSPTVNEVYEALIQVALFQHPFEEVRAHIDDSFMGYGSALDEKLKGWEGFHWMVGRQREELNMHDITINRYPVHKSVFADDQSAMVVEEIEFTLTTEEGPQGFTLRLTTIMEYREDRWMILHFHGSTADADTPEGNAWPIEEWKRRNAELQRAVEEKTNDLLVKNRDLEIEAALERVRSKSMAMQNPDELQEVVQVVAEELTKLGVILDIWGAVICTYFQDNKDVIHWTASDDPTHPSIPFLLPYFSDTLFDAAWESKARGDDYFARNFSFEVKNAFFQHAFEHSDYRNLPEDYKKAILETPTHAIAWAWSENSAIMIPSMQGQLPGEEEKEIIIRFAHVFEQAYIRFLDLQKAEAQTREAHIEAALEKVRSRSLAVNKSDEFNEVVGVVFEKLNELNFPVGSVTIALTDNGEKDWDVYGCGEGKSGLSLLKFTLPYFPNAFTDDIIAAQNSADSGYFSKVYSEAEKNQYYTYAFENTELKHLPDDLKQRVWQSKAYALSVAHTKNSTIMVNEFEGKVLNEDQANILKRFSRVFDQAYIRFRDLQKAETQAREAQIEVALERTRTQSMLMQYSRELDATARVFHEQLLLLGIESEFSYVWLPDVENENHMFWATWNVADQNGDHLQSKSVVYDLDKTEPYTAACFAAWESEEPVHVNPIPQEEVEHFFSTWSELLSGAENLKAENFPNGLYYAEAYMKYGCFGINIRRPLTKSEQQILLRFTIEFERTYTRFLDLQKAEEQAREAQVNLALERVRARTMAMHKSEELAEISFELFKQVQSLGVTTWHCAFNIYDESQNNSTEWGTNEGGVYPPYKTPREGIFLRYYEIGQAGETLHIEHIGEDKSADHYAYLCTLPGVGEQLIKLRDSGVAFPTSQIDHVAFFKYGYLIFITYDEVPKAHDIFRRFANIFEQTYTRFLDLKKAEALAREAQVELSLERIRARVTAMKESSDLLDIVVAMRKEFVSLGHEAHYFWHMRWLPEKYQKAMTSGDGTRIGMVMELPRRIHGEIKKLAEWEKSDEPTVVFTMDVEATLDYVHKMGAWGDFEQIDPNMPTDDDIRHIGGLTYVMARTTHGEIGFSLPGIVEHPPQESIDTLIRFAGVFDLAYRRFEDLKISEQQARETQIELALEKVRSRTMAMQRSDELPEAANFLFLQIQSLGIPAWSAGYCIWDNEDHTSATAFMSSEGVLQKPFSLPTKGVGYNFYDPLQKGESFHIEELGGEEIVKHYEFMRTLPVFGEVIDGILEAGFPLPTFQIFHIVFFPEGYLMFITYEQVPNAHDIFIRFAKVFEQTYTRFLDLQKTEEQAGLIRQEKERLEKTLSELQTTQKQLIHAEKMASLGELTAGIAHEIQNPLNFVNNFSEVSKELMEEMMEEMEKGDQEEVNAISSDIIQNLDKILHHGKRADGIVKGMLQHSRSSSGDKTRTDINELADEYLRLAYHGLRAKDKSFNATMETDFDESIGKVEIVPQEIGRVLLNLITNAFYACVERSRNAVQERSKTGDNGDYKPTVSVTTKLHPLAPASGGKGFISPAGGGAGGGLIQITVTDNGPGIPDDIKDKIFQPFFTTKPTGEGTGLGLSLSYDIVKSHGGEIKVDSVKGKGTRFIVTLPFV